MTPAATRLIAKTVIKQLIRLAIRYGKGELQALKPSVWEEHIGKDVYVDWPGREEGEKGKLLEIQNNNVTIETDKFITCIPNGITTLTKVKPTRRKVPDNPK